MIWNIDTTCLFQPFFSAMDDNEKANTIKIGEWIYATLQNTVEQCAFSPKLTSKVTGMFLALYPDQEIFQHICTFSALTTLFNQALSALQDNVLIPKVISCTTFDLTTMYTIDKSLTLDFSEILTSYMG